MSHKSNVFDMIREYVGLVYSVIHEFREFSEKYPEGVKTLMDPQKLYDIISSLSDEEAGRLLKVLIEVGIIASKISKFYELGTDELRELEGKLESILKKLGKS